MLWSLYFTSMYENVTLKKQKTNTKFTRQTNTSIPTYWPDFSCKSRNRPQNSIQIKELKKRTTMGEGKCVCVYVWLGGGGGGGGERREREWEKNGTKLNSSNLTNILIKKEHSQSAFFKDCFFLEGLEMTLMRLLWKTPMSCPPP